MPSASIDKPVADLTMRSLRCKILVVTGKSYLVDREVGLLDEHLLLVLARIGMIQMVLEPRSKYVGDRFWEIASPASTATVTCFSHRVRTHTRRCADTCRRVGIVELPTRRVVIVEGMVVVRRLSLDRRIQSIGHRIRLANASVLVAR